MMRVWRLSVAYIKTKIGTEVAHVTRESDTTFKVKGQLAGGGAYCGGLPHSLFLNCAVSWNWSKLFVSPLRQSYLVFIPSYAIDLRCCTVFHPIGIIVTFLHQPLLNMLPDPISIIFTFISLCGSGAEAWYGLRSWNNGTDPFPGRMS